jgi:hypothetical protein
MMSLEGDRVSIQATVPFFRHVHLFSNRATIRRQMERAHFAEPKSPRYRPVKLDASRWEVGTLFKGKRLVGIRASYPEVKFEIGREEAALGYFVTDEAGQPLMAESFHPATGEAPIYVVMMMDYE